MSSGDDDGKRSTKGGFFAVSRGPEDKQGLVATTVYRDGKPVGTYRDQAGGLSLRCRPALDKTLLASSKLKVERAKRHIEELELAIKAFHDSNPYDLIHEIDPDTGENVWRILVKEDVPTPLSGILGDAIHNLRAALDHLVCDLIRDAGGSVEPRGENKGFPVSKKAERLKPGSISKIVGVSPKAERFILRVKTRKRTNNPLWVLHSLDVIDKHNTIVTVGAATVQVIAKVGAPGMFVGPDGTIRLLGPGPGGRPLLIDAGTPDQFRRVFPLKDKVEVHRSPAGFNEDLQARVEVAFGQGQVSEGEPVVETIKQFACLVEGLIGVFERNATRHGAPRSTPANHVD